jgi:hypothetical protein
MRLLLLFLLCYFAYRYGRYLFAQFRQPAQQQQQQNQAHYSNNTNSASNRKKDDEGEYVDFEEIKD